MDKAKGLKPGDVVRFTPLANSPEMVVLGFVNGGPVAMCHWFDDHGTPHKQKFHESTLRKSPTKKKGKLK